MSDPSKKLNPITCAVVGLKQGLETVYVLLHHPAFTVKVVCDTDPEPFGWLTGRIDPKTSRQDYPHLPTSERMLAELSQTPGTDRIEWEGSFEAVLRRTEVEAVFLFVPDALHEAYAIAALEAGKYVLCTKPMALSIESAARIAAAARAHPHRYMLGFQFIYTPFAQRVMAEIRSGAIGAIRQMSFHFHRGPFRPIYRQKAVSGGTIIQECCHWLDLFQLFNGQSKFTKVAGFGGLDLHGAIQDIEDNGVVIIEYENRVRAALLFTYFRRTGRAELFTLNGERGQMRGSFDRVTIENDSGERTIEIPGNRRLPGLIHEGYYEMHDEFAAMIREGREPYSGWEAGLENVRLCDAAQRALDQGGVVRRSGP
jgi:predicted dehydrogenase